MKYLLITLISMSFMACNLSPKKGVVHKKLYSPEYTETTWMMSPVTRVLTPIETVHLEKFTIVLRDSVGKLHTITVKKQDYHDSNVGDTIIIK